VEINFEKCVGVWRKRKDKRFSGQINYPSNSLEV
jgi:hypothetical protein